MFTRKMPVTDRAKNKLNSMRAAAGGSSNSFESFTHERWIFIVHFIRSKRKTLCVVGHGSVSKTVSEYEFTRLLDLSGALRT